MPRITVAGGLCLDVVRAVVDGQVQDILAWTAVVVVVIIRVRARRGVVGPVPSIAFACSMVCLIVGAVIHRQVEGHDRIAVVSRRERLHVVAALRVDLTVPIVAFANRFREFRVFRVVNRQMQCVDTRTTFGIGVCVRADS